MKKCMQFLILMIVTFTVTISAAASENWPIKYGNPQLTKFNPVTLSNELFLKHEIDLPSIGTPNQMIVSGQTLYSIDSLNKKITALSLDTKAIQWEFTAPADLYINNFAVIDGHLFVSTNGKVYLLKDEGMSKSIVWEQDYNVNNISFDENFLYIADRTTIRALSRLTGELKWTYTLPAATEIQGVISVSTDKLFAITEPRLEGGRKLFALSKTNGQVAWTTSFPEFAMSPVVFGDKVIISSAQPKLFAFNSSNGSYAFRKTIESPITGFYTDDLSANDSTIFARTSNGMLKGFSSTGDIKFDVKFGEYTEGARFVSTSRGPILVMNNQLILENNGKLKFFDVTTGNHEHTISIPNVSLEPILVTSNYLVAKSSSPSKLYIYAPPKDPQYVDPDGDVQPEQPPAPDPKPEEQMIYVVKSGDTLWKIANQFGTTVQRITDLNKLDPNAYLWVGQNLTIPKPQKIHVVQAGDVLWKIAVQYGTTVQAIMEANNLSTSSYIWVGQRLVIPEVTGKVHIVQSGDTLWKISQQYQTTIQGIVEKNNLDPAKYLWVGQKLLIP